MPDKDEPFLKRWSRLKQGRGETDMPPRAADPAADPVSSNAAVVDGDAAAPSQPALDLDSLPRLEDLTAESDITAFLDRRVPAALRNAALGKMWQLDPAIRDFIEMAENQWNWNVPGGAPFYGPLEPGTDVAALVAQATGATWRHWQSDHEELSGQTGTQVAAEASAKPPNEPDIALQNASPPVPSALRETAPVERMKTITKIECEEAAASIPVSAAAQHPDAALGSSDRSPRRRHGAALPD